MKSYSDHLKSTRSFGEEIPKNYRPTMRSSAVFPVRVEHGELDTIITFMGYWLLKRSLQEVTVILTLRDKNGHVLRAESILIDEVKAYAFSINSMLNAIDSAAESFLGSIEMEIFSSRDMVFPYPAITMAFRSRMGFSFVHTCG